MLDDAKLESAVQEQLQAFRADLDEAAEQPPAFWTRQRARIHARVQEQRPPTGLRFALASSVALLVVAVSLLQPASAPVPQTPAKIDPDHQLMLDVESTLAGEAPQSLAPALLLANEIPTSPRNAREKKN